MKKHIELETKILALMAEKGYSPLTIDELAFVLQENGEDLKQAIKNLQSQYKIYKSKNHKWALLVYFNLYVGIIEIKEKGYGFIKSLELNAEAFVPKTEVNGALNKDQVLFRVTDYHQETKLEACVIKVIKRNLKQVIGVIINDNRDYKFKPFDEKLMLDIKIQDYKIYVPGDVVIVNLAENYDSDNVKGFIDRKIGNQNDVGIDILAIALKYDFEQDFSEEVTNEMITLVNNYQNYQKEAELKKRPIVDKKIITIDGDDAKDLDDAVSIEKLTNGNYQLGVYIADVSFFVTEKTALDEEALLRGTSVYLADRVIPMLPHKLSNDLCSLNEKTPKLVIACIMEINENGELVNHDIFEAVIETTHRMSYQNVNRILENDLQDLMQYQDIFADLFLMDALRDILFLKRQKRGSLDFDIPEAKIIVNEKGQAMDVVLRSRGKGEKLIEEFMLMANETVASCFEQLELPFIYRVHDVPSKEKLEQFKRIIKKTNYNIRQKNSDITSKSLQILLDEIKGQDIGLSTMLLRMMAKAKYSIENIGHYGLASDSYTHFTSPIRRYPDLLVHRLIRQYLFTHQVDVETQMRNTTTIIYAAELSSRRERAAIECEYEVNDMKMAEYMENHIGETFIGTISSVTSFGLFVTLPNTIEGLVRISSMKDDYYQYYDNLMALYGTIPNNIYRLGDQIKVKVISASKTKREIDFIITGKNNTNMLKYGYKEKQQKRGLYEKRRKENRR